MDNGPEFISDKLVRFCTENGVILNYIQQVKPQQNGLIERFNGSISREFLSAYLWIRRKKRPGSGCRITTGAGHTKVWITFRLSFTGNNWKILIRTVSDKGKWTTEPAEAGLLRQRPESEVSRRYHISVYWWRLAVSVHGHRSVAAVPLSLGQCHRRRRHDRAVMYYR